MKQNDNKKICGYLTDRKDGRYKSSLGIAHNYLKKNAAKLAFDPDFSREQFFEWKKQVRSKLLELMRFPDIENPIETELISTHQRDGYVLQKWEAYPEPGSIVPFLMLVPDGVDESNPAALVHCYPGSAHTKELLCGEPDINEDEPKPRHYEKNHMALEYVRQGVIAIAVENPGTGELAERGGSLGFNAMNEGRMKLSQDLIMIGRSYVGLSAFQKWTILQWSKKLSFVDPRRIALSAHSLGTSPMVVLGVLEDDLQAIVCNDYIGCKRKRETVLAPTDDGVRIRAISPMWHCIPDFWLWFSLKDLEAALAPTPLLLTEGGQTVALDELRQAYKISGAADMLEIHHYPKFAEPADRPYDYKELPEGLTIDEYFLRCNVDPPNHYFKGKIAVPWLMQYLKKN